MMSGITKPTILIAYIQLKLK